MNEPSIRKPTKKAFHFPKNADSQVADSGEAADASTNASSNAATADAQPAPVKTKLAKQKRVAPVKKAAVSANAEGKTKPTKKEKVVRDSFTMPKSDYEKITVLKKKCLDAGVSVKKSELLRAGLLLLESASDKRLLAAISAVETVKTGRPAKS